ncbi:MFS transporter [Kroppenstedtia eburnea]|uniref:MFS transporter n=1 Tax=Kroppenstedtia eburnea TaxID=714067 RepID=UPI00020C879D|nr:MFS family major facilitator superfamily transporter [Desmospora sp. 8437]
MADAQAGYKSLLKHPNYIYVWIGQTTANFGDSLYQIAFFWLAYKMTNSSLIAGLVVLATSAPYIFFGLLGGAYADRWDRKRVMVYGDVIRLISLLTVPLFYWLDLLTVWHLAVTAFVLSTVRCFFFPAMRASLTTFMPKELWSVANSFMQASFQLMRVIGPMIGGLLIARTSATFIYLITAAGFVVSILFLLLTKIPPVDKKAVQASVFRDIYDTFLFVKTIRPLFWSIFFFGVGLCLIVGLDRLGLPILSDQVWDMGSEGYGIILSSFAVGNLLMTLLIGKFKISQYARVIFTGWALWGVFYFLIGSTDLFYLAVSFAFLAGAAESLIDMPQILLVQNSVPKEQLGKVFSMQSTTAFIGESGSSLFAGGIIGVMGAAHSYKVAGIGLILCGVIGLLLTWSAYKTQPSTSTQDREVV